MGHSIQVVGERSAIIEDSRLIATVCLMDRALESHNELVSLRGIVERWKEKLRGYGPGIIDFDPELIALSRDKLAREGFMKLLDAVETDLVRFSDRIPAGILNSRSTAPGVTFFDYSPADIVDATTALRRLVAPSTETPSPPIADGQ